MNGEHFAILITDWENIYFNNTHTVLQYLLPSAKHTVSLTGGNIYFPVLNIQYSKYPKTGEIQLTAYQGLFVLEQLSISLMSGFFQSSLLLWLSLLRWEIHGGVINLLAQSIRNDAWNLEGTPWEVQRGSLNGYNFINLCIYSIIKTNNKNVNSFKPTLLYDSSEIQ